METSRVKKNNKKKKKLKKNNHELKEQNKLS